MMKKWYTLYTKPKAEYRVAATLRQQGWQVFLPEILFLSSGRKSKNEPFFPCYLFISVDSVTAVTSRLQWTPGLRRIVSFGDQPSLVPDSVINLIRGQLDKINKNGGWSRAPFMSGETVRITAGPMRDMLAIFQGPSEPQDRVQVLLQFLGRANMVWVEPSDLEKVPANVKVQWPRPPRRTRGRGRRIKGPQ